MLLVTSIVNGQPLDLRWTGGRLNAGSNTPRNLGYGTGTTTGCMAITCQFRHEAQMRGSDGDEGVSMM